MHDPEAYDKYVFMYNEHKAESLTTLIDQMKFKRKETLLDFGCGSGYICSKHFTQLAEKYDSQIKGIDISEKMLQMARAKYSHPRVHYLAGNIMDPKFPIRPATVDKIFAVNVLHFVKDYRSLFQKFHKLLTPRGQIGITTPGKVGVWGAFEEIGNSMKWAPYMEGFEAFVPTWHERNENVLEAFEQALEETGFTIRIGITQILRAVAKNVWELVEFYVSVNPFLSRIPGNKLEELRNDYRKIILEQNGLSSDFKDDEPLEHFYEQITCLAEKIE